MTLTGLDQGLTPVLSGKPTPPNEMVPHSGTGRQWVSGPNGHVLVLPTDQPQDVATGGKACDCDGPLQVRPFLTTGLLSCRETWEHATTPVTFTAAPSSDTETLFMDTLCVLVELGELTIFQVDEDWFD